MLPIARMVNIGHWGLAMQMGRAAAKGMLEQQVERTVKTNSQNSFMLQRGY